MDAIIYGAKSTQDKHGSVPTQLEDGRTLAEREGWNVLAEYSDEGFSAYSGNRGPALARAREHAAEAAPAVLVVQHSDRLARGAGDAPGAAEHLSEIVFWARRHNVQLRSVQDDSTFTNPLLAFAMGERNYEDSRRKGQAVKAGMRRRAERGEFNGRFPPYGYRREDGALVPEPAEAETLRRIYRDYAAGRSQLQIARELNRDGIRTQQGRSWYQASLRKLLVNPLYRGKITHDGEEFEGRHEAIIPEDLWRRVERLRGANTRTTGHGRGRRPRGRHLFIRGLLRCGECGCAMLPVTKKRGGSNYETYICDGRRRNGPDFCSMAPIPRQRVDSAVVKTFAKRQPVVERMERELVERIRGEAARVMAEREAAEREAKKARECYERVRRHYQEGRIEPDDWAEQRPQLMEELGGAEAALTRLREREREVASDEEAVSAAGNAVLAKLMRIWHSVTWPVDDLFDPAHIDEARAALRRLFDECVVRCAEGEAVPADAESGSLLLTPNVLHADARTLMFEPRINENALDEWVSGAGDKEAKAFTR